MAPYVEQPPLSRASLFNSHKLHTTPPCCGTAGDEPVDREETGVIPLSQWLSLTRVRYRCLRPSPCQTPMVCSSNLGDEPADTSVSPQKRRVRAPSREASLFLKGINASFHTDLASSHTQGVDDELDPVSLSPRKGRSAYDTGCSPSAELCTSFSPKKMRMLPASRDYRLGHGGALGFAEADVPVEQMPPALQGDASCKPSRTGSSPSPRKPRKAVSRMFMKSPRKV